MSAMVLVAEDEPLIAMDVIDELHQAGFIPVGPFARSEHALDFCLRRKPDCAVLDVRLADGESFPLADWLAARGVPFVFHSGHASRDALMQRYGGARICPKPAPAALLATAVAEMCVR